MEEQGCQVFFVRQGFQVQIEGNASRYLWRNRVARCLWRDSVARSRSKEEHQGINDAKGLPGPKKCIQGRQVQIQGNVSMYLWTSVCRQMIVCEVCSITHFFYLSIYDFCAVLKMVVVTFDKNLNIFRFIIYNFNLQSITANNKCSCFCVAGL